MSRPRLTIPTRIFLSFVLVLLAFGVVSAASLIQHQRTAARLRLLHEGYLPLALTIGQAKATQAVFNTLLDRVLQERDPRPRARGSTRRGACAPPPCAAR
ncbi:MAG: hypothetical protein M5U28_07515 [Sandaracinaceae bacterium]|nr:hypothetical protein [Sandaracinaceae bacterium]